MTSYCRDNSSAVCSGHGRCECGRCVCDAISQLADPELTYSGDFCQCNNYNCDYHDGLICGGPCHTHTHTHTHLGDMRLTNPDSDTWWGCAYRVIL